jgi:UDP-glucose 4-epimerase
VSRFVRNALRKQPLEIRGDGRQRRNFIYAEDLGAGSVAALAERGRGGTYLLAGASTSILELAELVREHLGDEVRIVFSGTTREDDYGGKAGDLAATEADLGWAPPTSLREGVRKYIAWCRASGIRS